jgi:hypothetical protein
MKLALRQRHGMTDDAIASFAVERDMTAAIRVPGVVGKRFWDSAIDDAVGRKCALLLRHAILCHRRQRHGHHRSPNGILP